MKLTPGRLFAASTIAAALLVVAATSTPIRSPRPSNPGTTIPSDSYLSFEDDSHTVSAYIYNEGDNPLGHNFFINSGYKSITIGGSQFPFALYVEPTVNPAINGSVLYVVFNAGGTVALKQVEVGPIDSGGAGYRALRILN